MTGDEEGQWMRDRFDQGMRDVPETLAPHEAIETGGRARRRRRRRAAVGGTIAAVLVAAGTATAIGLTSGGGTDHVATGSGPTASAATPAGAPSAVPYAEDLGRVSLAKGEASGHTWELVRIRSYGPYEAMKMPNGAPTGKSTGVAAAETRTGYCEIVELNMDGKLTNRGGGRGCADNPLWRLDKSASGDDFTAIGLGDTQLNQAGVGKLGTVSFGIVPQNATKVVATFDKDKATVDAQPQKVANDTYYVMFVPANAGHGDSATIRFYDANGKQIGNDHPYMGVGNGK
ncbi:hypothetical protein GCM10023205_38730 [Yinghuangia aomiensis]|uniref:Uncharacterized protein n=1 Tax=Yinghuangia aomiensis TaxID=676205 RepID=A0ABP9HFL8_9ACTN